MSKYLDSAGLAQLWAQIKADFPRMKHWSISAGQSADFTVAAGSRMVLYTIGQVANLRGESIVTGGNSSVGRTAVKTASEITFTASGLTLTVANGNASGYAVEVCFLIFVGGVTKS